MMLLLSLLAYIVTLGVLVTVHEYGHFWVARRLGVKVLRFSLGFGRPLYVRRFGADATEFTLCVLPLGGYVKMLDEREGPVAVEERHRAFNQQSLGVRTAVVVAGPLANFIFAIAAYWVMFVHGVAGVAPIVGEVLEKTPAASAGLGIGDRIEAVDEVSTPTWESVLQVLVARVLDGPEVTLQLRGADGALRSATLALNELSIDHVGRGELLTRLGALPERVDMPAVIGVVQPDSAALEGGLEPGDRVLQVGLEKIDDFPDLVDVVRSHPGDVLEFTVLRGALEYRLSITPRVAIEGDERIGRIGAGHDPATVTDHRTMAIERYDPATALIRAVDKTASIAFMTLRVMGKMLVGQASVDNLSGPIAIAEFAGRSALFGITTFLAFLAGVSISLGVLNLLPVPPLDGGHLLNYLVEFVQRKPLSDIAQLRLLQVGLSLLMALTVIALSNDIARVTLHG